MGLVCFVLLVGCLVGCYKTAESGTCIAAMDVLYKQFRHVCAHSCNGCSLVPPSCRRVAYSIAP